MNATVVICASPWRLEGRVPVARTGAQDPRVHLAAGAAQLVTVADWVLPQHGPIIAQRTGHVICGWLIEQLRTHYGLITDLAIFVIFVNNLVMRCLRG